ncbi:endonuclease/exonuclease/phosphatase family protein [Robiginitalea sp. M366]|uniref:endonuclease/exonuclease/phosphatase family protein n=1 Tax=Robiginitalea aestuariiviva TaxID=3036903 RepID=UPI00240DE6E2|nr:endonuclease/exonuclease/phosphatase family protein [Robiginitalea aestuariiviva]MDG1573304.1 endonuclease/exonuclease/phosphatase family protein [Robiginitalea aestuariiviva]
MPFYTNLKIRPGNSPELISKKKRTAAKLKALRAAILDHFNTSSNATARDKTIKIATWNIREFGGSKFKGRDFEPLYYIAEIISHFDIVALQEVRGDLKEFNRLLKILGPDWSFIATDVTDGKAGNGERMVFLHDRNKVHFKNIAGELTLEDGAKIRAAFGERIKLENGLSLNLPANNDLSGTYDARLKTSNGQKKLDLDLEIPLPQNCSLEIPAGSKLTVTKGTNVASPARGKATVTIPTGSVNGSDFRLRFPENSFDDSFKQFARTPFLIAFQTGWLKINLCTVHIYYGDSSDPSILNQRRDEIRQLTKALADKAKSEFKEDSETFLGVLGDFNIIGEGHPTMAALKSNDFVIPQELQDIPGSNVERNKAYDQIAFWKPNRVTQYARLDIKGANIFDFFEHVFKVGEEDLYINESPENGLKSKSSFKNWRTYKMSDHLPMWIELRNDFSNEYLDKIEST